MDFTDLPNLSCEVRHEAASGAHAQVDHLQWNSLLHTFPKCVAKGDTTKVILEGVDQGELCQRRKQRPLASSVGKVRFGSVQAYFS